AGIDAIHVPFRSTSESMPQLIGGQIDALFGDGPIIAPQVHAGHIVALAVAGPARGRAMPEVPTMAEAGFPGVQAESCFGFVVSSKTLQPIISGLHQAMAVAEKDPDFDETLEKRGASAGEPGPEA